MTAVAAPLTSAPRYHQVLSDNALEWGKWIAFGAMIIDHVNTTLLASGVPAMFAIGRIAFPLFAFVFGANLARLMAGTDNGWVAGRRSVARLVGFGAAAQIPFAFLHGQAWPLNVLFLFALAAVLVFLCRLSGGRFNFGAMMSAAVLFFVGGLLPEFFWFGLLVVFASVYLHRWGPSAFSGATFAVAVASLGVLNENAWALAALPVLLVLRTTRGLPIIPRLKMFFYIVYPAHLYVLWGIALATGGFSIASH